MRLQKPLPLKKGLTLAAQGSRGGLARQGTKTKVTRLGAVTKASPPKDRAAGRASVAGARRPSAAAATSPFRVALAHKGSPSRPPLKRQNTKRHRSISFAEDCQLDADATGEGTGRVSPEVLRLSKREELDLRKRFEPAHAKEIVSKIKKFESKVRKDTNASPGRSQSRQARLKLPASANNSHPLLQGASESVF